MAGSAYATPRASGSLVVSFGLVNVNVKYAPIVDPKGGRLSGKFLDPSTLTPAKQVYVNEATGEVVERVTGYPHGDGFVVLDDGDAQSIKAQRDGRLALSAFVEPDSVDPLFFEKDHIVWPDKGHETSYDVLCAVLEQSGKYLIGTTLLDSTRAVVLRYAHGCLFAHVCTYDSSVRWGNQRLVADAHKDRPAADPALVKMAMQVFDNLDDTFDLDAVTDDYDTRLRAAVEAAAEGKPVPKAPTIEATPVADLMEALKATVAAAGGKNGKPKSTRRKKEAAAA